MVVVSASEIIEEDVGEVTTASGARSEVEVASTVDDEDMGAAATKAVSVFEVSVNEAVDEAEVVLPVIIVVGAVTAAEEVIASAWDVVTC